MSQVESSRTGPSWVQFNSVELSWAEPSRYYSSLSIFFYLVKNQHLEYIYIVTMFNVYILDQCTLWIYEIGLSIWFSCIVNKMCAPKHKTQQEQKYGYRRAIANRFHSSARYITTIDSLNECSPNKWNELRQREKNKIEHKEGKKELNQFRCMERTEKHPRKVNW